MLIDEKALQKVLASRLQGKIDAKEIRQITQEILELGSNWKEVTEVPDVVGASLSVQCEDICMVGETLKKGEKIRLFRVREDDE